MLKRWCERGISCYLKIKLFPIFLRMTSTTFEGSHILVDRRSRDMGAGLVEHVIRDVIVD